MPVIDQRGQPLPEGHPFKGTRIFFGMNRPGSSETPSTEQMPQESNEALPDPMLPAMNGAERVLQELLAARALKPPK